MSGKDIFTDAVTGLASNGRVPFISEIGRRMQFFPTRMLGYYKKGLYRRTRDYATWINHRDVRVPVAESRNGFVFWSPPAGWNFGLYDEYGIYPGGDAGPWGFEYAGGPVLLVYTDPFQPHRNFEISDISFNDAPESGDWYYMGAITRQPFPYNNIGSFSAVVYDKYDAALYDYDQNFIGYLNSATTERPGPWDIPDFRKIKAYDYKFFLPITPEVVAAGAIKIKVETSIDTWPTDLVSVTLTVDGTNYVIMTGNGSWTMTVPVVDGSHGYLTTVATPVVPSTDYWDYKLRNSVSDFWYPILNSYTDASGQLHIGYRLHEELVENEPYYVLGDFAPITSPAVNIGYEHSRVYINGAASWSAEKEYELELDEYEDFVNAGQFPETPMVDTWYESYPIKKRINVYFYLPDS
jgi:hypothetical protein